MDVTYSHHLVGLVARAEVAAARLAAADPDRRAAAARHARREAARLSARLDGSPLEDATADAVDAGRGPKPPAAGPPPAGGPGADAAEPDGQTGDTPAPGDTPGPGGPVPPAPSPHSGGWARVLRLEGMPTQDVAAVEYANLLAVAEQQAALAENLPADPLDTLRRLHTAVTDRLVAPEVAGAWRRTEQAIHDGAQGMVIYNAPPPAAVPEAMAALERWLRRAAAVVPGVIVAGVVHERILEIQPFEAANGRVARAAARLVLHARGIDPHGAAVPERALAADPAGYYREVAATIRRRGALQRWLERHTAAVAAALEEALETIQPTPRPEPPPHARAVVADLPAGSELTLADYARDAAVGLAAARHDLGVLARAGLVAERPGTSGLRFVRTATPA